MEKNVAIVPNQAELEQQFEFVNSLIERHRSAAVTAVNTEALQMNWEIGQYISLQLASARWGTNVVGDLADYLKRQNPKRRGFSKRNLYNMVKFYDTYSQPMFIDRISQLKLNVGEFVQLPTAQTNNNAIVQLPTAQLEPTVVQTIPPILTVTTFTNHVEIMNRCRSDDERIFYMLYARHQGLKTEELRR